MKVLILGGISESKTLANQLVECDVDVIYSIVGLLNRPLINCKIHSGGFSTEKKNGVEGMVEYISKNNITLIIDSTHPYAEKISANAVGAGKKSRIECWRLDRAKWDLSHYHRCSFYNNWDDLLINISHHKRPFFRIGRSIKCLLHKRPELQNWIVRSMNELECLPMVTNISVLNSFSYIEECKILKQYSIDALITRDSGGEQMKNKVSAANDCDIPIYIYTRPNLVEADRTFSYIEDVFSALCSRLKDDKCRF